MKPISITTLGLIAALSATFGLATVSGASAQPAGPAVVAQQSTDATSGSASTESQGETQSRSNPFNDESDNGPEFAYGQ